MADNKQDALDAYAKCIEAVREARRAIPAFYDDTNVGFLALVEVLPDVRDLEEALAGVAEMWGMPVPSARDESHRLG